MDVDGSAFGQPELLGLAAGQLRAGGLAARHLKLDPHLEAEVDDAVDALSSLMEPMIMAVLGVVIGGLVIAMYLPIFKMGQAV